MTLNFKKDAETIYTSEMWYDIFEGGYIKPEDLLEAEDAEIVNDCIKVLRTFVAEAEELGLIEIG